MFSYIRIIYFFCLKHRADRSGSFIVPYSLSINHEFFRLPIIRQRYYKWYILKTGSHQLVNFIQTFIIMKKANELIQSLFTLQRYDAMTHHA